MMTINRPRANRNLESRWVTIGQLQEAHPGFTSGWIYKFSREADSYALGHLVQKRGGRTLVDESGFMAAFQAGWLDNKTLAERARLKATRDANEKAGKKTPAKVLEALPRVPLNKRQPRWVSILEA
jgi:hypothetical protein